VSARQLTRGDGVKKTLELELDISVSCSCALLAFVLVYILYPVVKIFVVVAVATYKSVYFLLKILYHRLGGSPNLLHKP